MKYDSGMTSFNKDIIAVLRYMLKGNKEITEKFSPGDGSPAPLREYLKQKYGKSCASHIGDGMRYSCKTASGLELTFGIILNNPGDKNLTLSWSQVAKFIRDNWDEVFKKSEAAEQPSPQISYIDKLREKYPKINETDDWFDTVYCPSELLDGDGVNDPELAEELADLREENERLKNGSIKSFIIRLTLDEYDRLLDKVDDDFNLKYIIKHAKLLKL